jgi:N-acetylmuramoyl-L-alanine amidase
MKIVIDPGHGGYDSGAVSHDGKVRESDIVLSVGLMLKDHLDEVGFEVIMTRETDTFLSLAHRAAIANKYRAPLLSIHCNSGGGTGFEAFTSPGKTSSDAWATALLQQYAKDSPLPPRYDMRDGDPDKEARFTVLTASNGPAVLFELGFIDRQDTAWLATTANIKLMARSLAKGTVQHFKPLAKPAKEESQSRAGELARIWKTLKEIEATLLKLEND